MGRMQPGGLRVTVGRMQAWGEEWGPACVWVVRPVPALTGSPPLRYKIGTLSPTLLSFQKGHREGEEEAVSCTPWQVSSHWKGTAKVLPPSGGQDPELVRLRV